MALHGSDRDHFGRNVLGTELECCCTDPVAGYFRDGYCRTDPTDTGHHFVCAEMTAEFLEFSLRNGNDLVTEQPEYDFPGLKPGDRWCLCVERWVESPRGRLCASGLPRSNLRRCARVREHVRARIACQTALKGSRAGRGRHRSGGASLWANGLSHSALGHTRRKSLGRNRRK
jgi:uncharacterized protein